jgi:hypothetical protein
MVDRENWQILQASETSDLAVTPSRIYGLRNTRPAQDVHERLLALMTRN